MTAVPPEAPLSSAPIFRPLVSGALQLPNRLVMAPMTRRRAPGGVPGMENAAYYRRRAEAGVGLVVTEGTWINHPVASDGADMPRFYGEDALAGWKLVVDEVHQAGGRIVPQLWHTGTRRTQQTAGWNPEMPPIGPSGLSYVVPQAAEPTVIGPPMSQADIDAVIAAFGQAAADAYRLGFDGIEIHGAHGYLIDQFLWDKTNLRTDRYGGTPAKRAQFAVEIVRECRRRTHPDFPIGFRFSQWKAADYDARIANSGQELSELLEPLVDAGVDMFHCSTRRYWEPAFQGSELSLAGWTKQITGKTTIAVGSVGLDQAHQSRPAEAVNAYTTQTTSLDRLIRMLDRGEFDLIAVGRSLLVDPTWPVKVREEAWDQLVPYYSAARDVMH